MKARVGSVVRTPEEFEREVELRAGLAKLLFPYLHNPLDDYWYLRRDEMRSHGSFVTRRGYVPSTVEKFERLVNKLNKTLDTV